MRRARTVKFMLPMIGFGEVWTLDAVNRLVGTKTEFVDEDGSRIPADVIAVEVYDGTKAYVTLAVEKLPGALMHRPTSISGESAGDRNFFYQR